MTNKTTDSLTQLYAQASAAQTPDAPPALSAAIMHAAAQAVVLPSATPSVATGKHWAARLAVLPALFNKTASTIQNVFTIPTIRYGLPAMMVAAVGFKIALPEAPSQQAPTRPSVAAPMLDGATPAAAAVPTTTKNSAKAAAASGLTTSAIAGRSETKPAADSIRANAPSKDAVLDNNKNSGVADAMGKTSSSTINSPTTAGFGLEKAAPQAFPAQQASVANKAVGELSRADSLPVPAKPAAAAAIPPPAAAPVPIVPAPASVFNTPASANANSSVLMGAPSVGTTVTGAVSERGNEAAAKKGQDNSKLKREAPVAIAAPAPSPAPAAVAHVVPPAVPATLQSAVPQSLGELSGEIPKELRLRWLIATSRMVDGAVRETCNPQAPDLERVQAWLKAGANPNYRFASVPNAPSTLALAQRCGFSEAAAAMQASSIKP
jgi:hypothetical protein